MECIYSELSTCFTINDAISSREMLKLIFVSPKPIFTLPVYDVSFGVIKRTIVQFEFLEGYEMIYREIYKHIPPKVEYSLTKIGVKFLPVMSSLEEWAIKYEQYKTSKV